VNHGNGGYRAGFVALVGLPNVGKSTLLNRLMGTRMSIVTPKAQTTRRRLLGIYSDESHQAIFVDTPGRLEPRYLLQEAMRAEATRAVDDADVLVYVVDAGYADSLADALAFKRPNGIACLLCLNKVDRVSDARSATLLDELNGAGWETVIPTVATAGKGIEALRRTVLAELPVSPPYYPADELSTAPLRYFAAEFVREACFDKLGQELPYSIEVMVDEFKERGGDRPTYIAARLFVERESQKGMVIGDGGTKIREIGSAARQRIEEFLEHRVYLDLRVRVLPKWRKRADHLKRLGYNSLQ
jgi:GTP-binding protein Era